MTSALQRTERDRDQHGDRHGGHILSRGQGRSAGGPPGLYRTRTAHTTPSPQPPTAGGSCGRRRVGAPGVRGRGSRRPSAERAALRARGCGSPVSPGPGLRPAAPHHAAPIPRPSPALAPCSTDREDREEKKRRHQLGRQRDSPGRGDGRGRPQVEPRCCWLASVTSLQDGLLLHTRLSRQGPECLCPVRG